MASRVTRSAITRMARCQEIIGYHFENPELLREALDPREQQRLALVGDRIAETLIIDRWYSVKSLTPRQWDDGVRTCLSNKTLAEVGIRNGFIACMDPMPPTSVWGERRTKLMADTVEAVLGAVYRDAVYKNGNRDLGGWVLMESMIDRLGITARLLVAHSDRQWTLHALRTRNKLSSQFFSGRHRLFMEILDNFSNEKRPIILPRDAEGCAIHRPLREALAAQDDVSEPGPTSTKARCLEPDRQKVLG